MGAALIHGCDNYEKGIQTCARVVCRPSLRRNRFEVVDLTQGPKALGVFNAAGYDIVLCLATYHKLKRLMPERK
jgi:hypothetical protein